MSGADVEEREPWTAQPHPLDSSVGTLGSVGICIVPPSGNIPVSASPRSRTRSSNGAWQARVVPASASHSNTPVISR